MRIFSIIIFAGIIALSPAIVRTSWSLQQNKADLGNINHIYYGIFNVNSWKAQVASIALAEVKRLDIKSTITKLKGTVENQLTSMIDKLNERIREANSQSFGGKIKQLLINLVVNIEDIKKGIPNYADVLINEITKPETEKRLKNMAASQLQSYFDKTYEKINDNARNEILKRYGYKNAEEGRARLVQLIETKTLFVQTQMAALIGLSILLFIIIGLTAPSSRLGIALLSSTLLLLMGLGVSTPMIDLEAKINEMSFYLLGHKILFEDQVLYFQSKSVLDVFKLMIQHQDHLMKFVGILMITFSIVIPVLKLASSLLYRFSLRMRESWLINFIVFKSGKWSMADVMVVAIFMAYIGFNGIVSNQFGKIKSLVPEEIVFITTNGTSLQPGFFAFLAYAILALFLTGMIKPKAKSDLDNRSAA